MIRDFIFDEEPTEDEWEQYDEWWDEIRKPKRRHQDEEEEEE